MTEVRGWCPGAWRPMMSGDGLVVRIRPPLCRLTPAQAEGLGALARRYGSGVIEVTRRANIQLRGVSEARHPALMEELAALDLLDGDPVIESRRNMLVAGDDVSTALARELTGRLVELPDLPAKFGVALDAGPAPVFTRDPADIRIERGAAGLILRADGARTGIAPGDPVAAILDLARWFAVTRRDGERRMAALIARTGPPPGHDAAPHRPAPAAAPGPTVDGLLVGLPFGQIDAALWREATGRATAIHVTPWRMLHLVGAGDVPDGLIASPGDPLLTVDACPGAPLCPQATVETRTLARRLAGRAPSLHVSGCAKGCARSAPAAATLVGRDGRFDLVTGGRAGDTPTRRGLTPDAIPDAL